jgi:hypothetical protein
VARCGTKMINPKNKLGIITRDLRTTVIERPDNSMIKEAKKKEMGRLKMVQNIQKILKKCHKVISVQFLMIRMVMR